MYRCLIALLMRSYCLLTSCLFLLTESETIDSDDDDSQSSDSESSDDSQSSDDTAVTPAAGLHCLLWIKNTFKNYSQFRQNSTRARQ